MVTPVGSFFNRNKFSMNALMLVRINEYELERLYVFFNPSIMLEKMWQKESACSSNQRKAKWNIIELQLFCLNDG